MTEPKRKLRITFEEIETSKNGLVYFTYLTCVELSLDKFLKEKLRN